MNQPKPGMDPAKPGKTRHGPGSWFSDVVDLQRPDRQTRLYAPFFVSGCLFLIRFRLSLTKSQVGLSWSRFGLSWK